MKCDKLACSGSIVETITEMELSSPPFERTFLMSSTSFSLSACSIACQASSTDMLWTAKMRRLTVHSDDVCPGALHRLQVGGGLLGQSG